MEWKKVSCIKRFSLFVFSVEYRASPEHHVVIYRDLIDLSEVIRRRIHVQVSLSST